MFKLIRIFSLIVPLALFAPEMLAGPFDQVGGAIRGIFSASLILQLGTLAIIISLLGALFHPKIEWRHFMWIVFVVAGLFLAEQIVTWIQGAVGG